MVKVFLDTETCGLHGMPVLLQYAYDDGPIHLHEIWREPICETLRLIEDFCECDGVVGFNLAFDWFQLCKAYTVFSLWKNLNDEPSDIIEELALLEPAGRDGPCVKPRSACDIMLLARKGAYQSTMDRGDIRIRRVPTSLAFQLAIELETRIPLSDIYFARKKDKTEKWKVYDIENNEGEVHPDFKDVVLKFAPSSALKALASDALGIPKEEILRFDQVSVDECWYPEELGYAPFALATGQPGKWNKAWPEMIRHHILHWRHHTRARLYATKDVEYTRALYKHFGSPSLGDTDSILACMIAAVRWRGFRCDLEGLKKLKEETLSRQIKIVNGVEFKIPTAPEQARRYIQQPMDETERICAARDYELNISTNKILLEKIAKNFKKDCPACYVEMPELDLKAMPEPNIDELFEEIPTDDNEPKEKPEFTDVCPVCKGEGFIPHESAKRAQEVLDARKANYEADLYDKFILAGRFHASFKVIGTLSSRMSGTDGLNAQGIKKSRDVRSKFPLAWIGYKLSGGDFAGFEVTLAEADYNDENLRKQLLTCEKCGGAMTFHLDKNDFLCQDCGSNKGKKIHALFGIHVYPEHTYESLKKTEGSPNDQYTKAKSGIFAMMYGGTEKTLVERLGVPIETALAALARFHREFPGVRKAQMRVTSAFCSMRQVGGIGSRVEWRDPADYIESMFGFRRYFTLENKIAKVLFELAQSPPRGWRDIPIRVQRRDRLQTAMGAVQSALYGAAFQLQAGNTRAAINHVIQSSGATITKEVERDIWEIQPPGIHKFRVMPMNIHDEIQCPTLPEYVDQVAQIVRDKVETFRPKVPLIRMDWQKYLNSWADKS